MIAHNLCYSTLISKENSHASAVTATPSGSFFVHESVRKGLLPEILIEVLNARAKAKQDLKNETDPFKRKILDGRQYALKVSANSVYGFTGAQKGYLPCLQISESVTSFGRQMIEFTREQVQCMYEDAVVIYGDTDSVMVKFGCNTVAEAMILGKQAAAYISTKFKQPIKLDFEKVYFPYLLINKKKYAGLQYSSNSNSFDKMDCKGIETVRRDNCLLVSKLITACLRMILMERNPDAAIAHTKRTISDLLCDRIDLADLIITKEYKKSDYVVKQAHVELAHRMAKRDAGSAPKLGDRVPYVMIVGSKRSPGYLKSEDPIHVLENKIPIDAEYYLNNQLSKPLLRIFQPIFGDEMAKSIIFTGDHLRKKTKCINKAGPLAKYLINFNTCINCSKRIHENQVVCESAPCIAKKSEALQVEMIKQRDLESMYNALWTQCQRCTNTLHKEIICSAYDCPIYYKRVKTIHDLNAQSKIIKKFNDWY